MPLRSLFKSCIIKESMSNTVATKIQAIGKGDSHSVSSTNAKASSENKQVRFHSSVYRTAKI